MPDASGRMPSGLIVPERRRGSPSAGAQLPRGEPWEDARAPSSAPAIDRPGSTCGSVSSSSPTTPPRRSRRPWTGCPPSFARDGRPRPGVRRREPRRHLRGRPRATSRRTHLPLTVVKHPREPRLRRQPEGRLPLGHRPRPRHRGAAARRRPVRARGASRASSTPLVRGEADAVFGSRMMERGEARAGRHAALQVRRQPDPHHVPEHGHRPRPHASGTAATAPTASTRSTDIDLDSLHQRLRLRHRDHPGPARRREADRRGADPDLLRRRDLLRQRHEVRQAT